VRKAAAVVLGLALCVALVAVAHTHKGSAPDLRSVTAAKASSGLHIARFAHIFVIVEENHGFNDIIGSVHAPALNRFANEYGLATRYYAVTHPSEPNYVALIGGYTFGIRDDDAFYCSPGSTRPHCSYSRMAGYVDHTIDAPNLATQLQAAHLSWKNYNESLPAPGSLAIGAADPKALDVSRGLQIYASKHSGFLNYASVQRDPHRAQHIVGFDELRADLRSGRVPNFSFVIPNLCDDMHGGGLLILPENCSDLHPTDLIERGDRTAAGIVAQIMASPAWRGKENSAIVITWDEDDGGSKASCCGTDPKDPANAGGGHIATIVITNHGPRHVADATPYSHYSLLRTIEDAFGIRQHLQRAAAPGVVDMTPLFNPPGGRRS